jgi:uncharacterized protein YxeA
MLSVWSSSYALKETTTPSKTTTTTTSIDDDDDDSYDENGKHLRYYFLGIFRQNKYSSSFVFGA